MSMKVGRTLSICTFLLWLVTTASALDPDRHLYQLAHRSWGEKEGYPGRAQALAQTTDGFLWIATDKGLFRFDGVHFERYVPRSGAKLSDGPLRGLLALPDGSLWIAYRLESKICVLRNGNLKCYGEGDGITSNPTTIVQDHDGTLWANTEGGVIRFNGRRWEHIGKDWNFPEDVPRENSIVLFVDSHGTIWAGVNHTILCLKQGSRRFEPTGAFAGWSVSVAEAPDGSIWLADNFSYVRAISAALNPKSAATAKCDVETREGGPPKCPSASQLAFKISGPDRLLFDRNGSLWVTSDTSGVFRVPRSELLRERPISKTSDALQSFTSKDGLSADDCNPILEDREGNIWVGTRDGLDLFRDTTLIPVALPTSIFQTAIAPADSGDIWVAGSWAYVARIHADSRNVSLVRADAFKPYRDPAGVTWLMGNSLGRWKDGRFQRVAPSPDGRLGSFSSWQIAGDRFGTLWAFSDGLGFFSLDHDRWKAWETPAEVAKQHVADMYSDSTGQIWTSTYEGEIITMDRGTIVVYPRKPNSSLRYVETFAEHAPQEIWAGGERGLVLIDKGHSRLIRPATLDSLGDVTGIVDAGSDGLWLNSSEGVIHVPRDEVGRALSDSSYRFQWERFDSSDGLPGQTVDIYPFPKAVQGTDGRIWFTATKGVAWIDPKKRKILRNALPPPVSITSISADGSLHLQLTGLRLPAHTANVQINYTALSLSAPERVRFRYRLEGSDNNWQDVGTRREAFYTNLGPRPYRFRVIACNQDGVWNNVGALVEFTIAPAWYQTSWFRLGWVAALLLLLCVAYMFRVRQLKAHFAAGLEARVDERTRIARELHDTLLQSFQGVAFQIQAARNLLLRKADNVSVVLDEAILATEEAIREGRSAIRDLRPEPVGQRDLPELLNAVGNELTTSHEGDRYSSSYRVVIEGKQQELSPMLQDEVYRISREVIRNAFAHAAASHIEVEIRYDQDQLRLRVRDDGKGIDSNVLAGGQSGHFGIPGMRERAQRIGARLDFWSEMGAGTEVELTVPASMAYEKQRDGRRFRFFNRAGTDDQRT
jgi:signal transduction histidine kinase/ligand-binding sensor domain-containing protein